MSEFDTDPPAPRQSLTGIAVLNAVMGFAARISGLVVGIVLTPFILHRIGRELYGISATAGSVLEYLWLLRGGLGSGMRRYVTVHYHAGEHDLARHYYAAGFWWSFLLRLLVVGAGIALSRMLCDFMRISPNLMTDAVGGMMLIFVTAGVSDLGGIFEVPTYVTGHTSSISVVRTLGILMRIVFVIPAFLLFEPSLRLYGLAALLSELVGTIAMLMLGSRQSVVQHMIPKIDFGEQSIRGELFRFSGLGMLSQAAAILYLATDNLLIGRFYGPARVTEYALGTRWAPMIQAFLWAGVSALMPLFTRMEVKGDIERTKTALLKSSAVITAIGVPLCLVPCVIGDVFLEKWVGAEYRHCVWYMVAMLLPMLAGLPLEPLWVGMMARGRIGWIAVGDVIAAVINPFLSMFLALKFGPDHAWGLGMGPIGFALGNTVAILMKNLLLRPLMNRGEEAMPSLRRTMAVLPMALLGGTPALALLWFTKPWYGHSLPTIVAAAFVGGVLCLAGCVVTAVGLKDTNLIIGSLRSRVLRAR